LLIRGEERQKQGIGVEQADSHICHPWLTMTLSRCPSLRGKTFKVAGIAEPSASSSGGRVLNRDKLQESEVIEAGGLLSAGKNGTREKSHQQGGSASGGIKTGECEEWMCLAELAQIEVSG
jgi:hypothetical protein